MSEVTKETREIITSKKKCKHCGNMYSVTTTTISIDGEQQGEPNEQWVNHWRSNCKGRQKRIALKLELNYMENRKIKCCAECKHSNYDYEDRDTHCYLKPSVTFEVDQLGICDKYEQ